jgi:methionine synthase II (cobalamin-independent)
MWATAIGSLPHRDPEEACRMTLRYLEWAPAWPQLPRRSFRENMYAQYSEGMPGVVVDENERRVHLRRDEGLFEGLERAYQAYLDANAGEFAISEDFAAGLHAFTRIVSEGDRKYPVLKGQITGPVSYGLTVLDENKRPMLYDEQVADAMVRVLNLKARWMEGVLRGTGRTEQVLIFFDEPYLVSVGSALVSLDRERVVNYLRACVENLGCLTGSHCCGNTDWSILFQAGLDVVSFDAFNYMESLALYPEEPTAFLERGGILAWGLVPNTEEVYRVDADGLARRFEEGVSLLRGRGVPEDLLRERSMVTPSCGLEGVEEEAAERAYALTAELARFLG